MKKLGKSSKKGFTLVELIVVLVILAVLAAMLVPALVGYIDRAKKEKEFQAASTVYAGVQALATEAYGKSKAIGATGTTDLYDKFTVAEVKNLTGVTVNAIKFSVNGTTTDIDKYTIKDIGIQFTSGGNWYKYSINDKTWETTADATYSGNANVDMPAGTTSSTTTP